MIVKAYFLLGFGVKDYGNKLSNYNINSSLRIIQSIYNSIKSCLILNNIKNDFFLSNIGVRQGENLSLLLFNLFLNDEAYFRENVTQGIFCGSHALDETIAAFLKIPYSLYLAYSALSFSKLLSEC